MFLCCFSFYTERVKRTQKSFFFTSLCTAMFFFSPPGEKKQPKRELVARFESEQITILKNCAAGLASLKQVLALTSSPFFNHRICVPDSPAIATNIE